MTLSEGVKRPSRTGHPTTCRVFVVLRLGLRRFAGIQQAGRKLPGLYFDPDPGREGRLGPGDDAG